MSISSVTPNVVKRDVSVYSITIADLNLVVCTRDMGNMLAAFLLAN